MSATAEMKTKDSKRKSESKRTGTSEKKAAANKRNSEKSTGPRTAEGKEKSKFNSTTHGLTARSALLPGEDPAGLNALRCELLEGLQPRNSLESTLIVRIAEDKWISDRAEQAASRRVAERLRHEPLEQAQKESDDALELGEHLLWNLARPLPFDASSQSVSLGEPPHAGEPVHPSHPTRVRLRLETTVAGCDWLLDRWGELDRRLRIENAWLPSDAFKMVRLLGMHAIDMDEDFEVARLLMSSLIVIHALEGTALQQPANWPLLLTRMLASYDFEGRDHCIDGLLGRFTSYIARLARVPFQRMAPESAAIAREWLTNVIDGEIKRAQNIRTKLKEIADTDAAEAPIRFWFETGPEAENHRRYALSNKRVLNRTISNFLIARKQSEAGAFEWKDGGMRIEDGGTHWKDGSTRIEDGGGGEDPARENDGGPLVEPQRLARCEQLVVATPESEVICDDELVLRNEPIAVASEVPTRSDANREPCSPPVDTSASVESATNPKRQRGSLSTAAVVIAPDAVVVAPETDVVGPDTLVVAPETVATAPDTLVVAPETVATAPDTLVVAPETVATAPDTLVVAPETVATAPETVATAPETVATAPETVATAPVGDIDPRPMFERGPKELAFGPGRSGSLVVPLETPSAEPCESLPPSHVVAPGVQPPSSVQSPAPSVIENASCGDEQFLRNEPKSLVVRNSEGHQVGEQKDNLPRINDKKLTPEQMRVLGLQRWQERKLRELREAGWTEPFSSGIP